MRRRNEGSLHASKLASDKFQSTLFIRSRTWFDTEKEIQAGKGGEGGSIVPKATCKYLGMVMDQKLD